MFAMANANGERDQHTYTLYRVHPNSVTPKDKAGMFCVQARKDVWASFRLMTALTQWADSAGNATTAEAIHGAVGAYLRELSTFVHVAGGFTASAWAHMRWPEAAAVCLWHAAHPGTAPADAASSLALARTLAARLAFSAC